MEVAVIGGGAAGFFAAISCKTHHPKAKVTIYEKSDKLLAKVKVSGGGRCNVTHACFSISELAKHYPRGDKQLKKAFAFFSVKDTVAWFESRRVKLKTEEDNRMFPVTDNSQTIINCLMEEVQKLGIPVKIQQTILAIEKGEDGFKLLLNHGQSILPDKIIVASGGSPKLSGFEWLKNLGHSIETPVPSLFTFNMPGEPIIGLMGVSAGNVSIHIQGTKLKQQGPLLITHWGMSGPAVLKLSAWGARILHGLNYKFKVQVNWLGKNEHEIREQLTAELEEFRKRKIANKNPFQLANRLWLFLLQKAEVDPDINWGDIPKAKLNKLLNTLLNDEYLVEGKTTFKEEFVTCGGVSLQEIDMNTMQSNICPGLYFAGEVLDVDGVTGGFNFQAAWTTGFIAGKLL
jgi:predicted Rossmann fold flavoprotein